MLADMRPGFVRFPGGCIVEGRYLTNRYQWKTTIGNPEERKLMTLAPHNVRVAAFNVNQPSEAISVTTPRWTTL